MLILIVCNPIEGKSENRPYIAIIMDDMGLLLNSGLEAISLSGDITYSFLPYTPYANTLAMRAYRQGKEIMLHAPMQSLHINLPDTDELSLKLPEDSLITHFSRQLLEIPNISGINNHKGSLLTQKPEIMQTIMQVIKDYPGRQLFFVDSLTTESSVAAKIAELNQVPTITRDIFLDHDYQAGTIRQQFIKMVNLAKRQGFALGIAHPRKLTLNILRNELGRLEDYGVELITVSAMIELQKSGMMIDVADSKKSQKSTLSIRELDIF